jgi:K+-sensing histidine kinase KdpD
MYRQLPFYDHSFGLAKTALGVGACVAFGLLLEAMNVSAPYLVFVPAIAGSCAIAGFSAGVWAIFLSTFGLWFFFLPPEGFTMPSYGELGHLCVFVLVTVFLCWIIDGQRRSNNALSRDNIMLGFKISTLLNRKKAL